MALCLVIDNTVEIKNIAIDESCQGRGYGKWLVVQLCCKYASFARIIVGTANASISNIAFYQKLGFTLYNVKWHYFIEHYTQSIVEDGIVAEHMLMFEYVLNKRG